jgi:hypothetical protein
VSQKLYVKKHTKTHPVMKKLYGLILLMSWIYQPLWSQSFWKTYGNPTHPLAAHSDLLYVPLTNALLVSTYNMGIFRSTDGGNTWQHTLSLAKDQPIHSLYLTSQGTILAGGSQTLYRSTNQGDKWEEIPLKLADVHRMVDDRQGSIYACSSSVGGIIKSDDQGLTWKDWNEGLPLAYVNELLSDGKGHVFCSVFDEESTGKGGLYYWDRAQQRWKQKEVKIQLGAVTYPMRIDLLNAMAVSATGKLYLSFTGTIANFTESGIFTATVDGAIREEIWHREKLNEAQTHPIETVVNQLFLTQTGHLFGGRISGTSAGIYTKMSYTHQWISRNEGINPISQVLGHFQETPDGSVLLTTDFSRQIYITQEGQPGKKVQQIQFDPLSPMKLYETAPLQAQSSSGLPVQFRSLNSDQAYLTDNQVRAVGLGTVGIRAYVEGNDSLYYGEATQSLVISRAANVITLEPIPDQIATDPPIILKASAASGLPVQFRVTKGEAELIGDTLQPKGAGEIELIATEPGNETYAPADTVRVRFCVMPAKPTLVLIENSPTGSPQLQSTPGASYQWYRNGERLPDAGQILKVIQTGDYTVKHQAAGCLSAASDPISVSVTGREDVELSQLLRVYPVPFGDHITISKIIQEPEALRYTLVDAYGRVLKSIPDESTVDFHFQTSAYFPGLYFLRVDSGKRTAIFKLIKAW